MNIQQFSIKEMVHHRKTLTVHTPIHIQQSTKDIFSSDFRKWNQDILRMCFAVSPPSQHLCTALALFTQLCHFIGLLHSILFNRAFGLVHPKEESIECIDFAYVWVPSFGHQKVKHKKNWKMSFKHRCAVMTWQFKSLWRITSKPFAQHWTRGKIKRPRYNIISLLMIIISQRALCILLTSLLTLQQPTSWSYHFLKREWRSNGFERPKKKYALNSGFLLCSSPTPKRMKTHKVRRETVKQMAIFLKQSIHH